MSTPRDGPTTTPYHLIFITIYKGYITNTYRAGLVDSFHRCTITQFCSNRSLRVFTIINTWDRFLLFMSLFIGLRVCGMSSLFLNRYHTKGKGSVLRLKKGRMSLCRQANCSITFIIGFGDCKSVREIISHYFTRQRGPTIRYSRFVCLVVV